jgi:hypothetical protein
MDDRRVNPNSSTRTGRCKWAACISALTACATSLESWDWAGPTCPGAQDSPAVSGQYERPLLPGGLFLGHVKKPDVKNKSFVICVLVCHLEVATVENILIIRALR